MMSFVMTGSGTYMLDERTLMLEGVTLAEVVELVVEVFVDLAGGAVLDKQAAEDAETTHPHDLTVIISASASRTIFISVIPSLPHKISCHLFRQNGYM